ncbi:MAG: DUF4287 domain-containing protein [Ramlibacter sp.]|nr:DUF4287 domain-containing protein [Ramlibacter sp.]
MNPGGSDLLRRPCRKVGQILIGVDTTGPLKHMELVSHLKTEHGLGHGHANALVAAHLAKKK